MQAAVEANPTPIAIDELEAIYKKHHGLVFRAAYRVTGDAADAEDVLQTVFLRLARREAGAVEVRGVESYLYRAAVNAALDLARSRSRKSSVALEEAGTLPSTEAALAPDRSFAAGEIRSWLRDAISRLSPRAAEIVVLRFFEGKQNAEIARILDTSPSTVAVTLHRTRERLQSEFRAELGGTP